MNYKFFYIFLISINFLSGFEFSKLTSVLVKEGEKIFKTIGISSVEKQLLKNARFVSVYGKLVAERDSTFYPYIRDASGRTNVERMREGLAPIGKDGLPVQLHHLKQQDNGVIVELTATEHRSDYKILHRYEDISQIDRSSFDKWRKKYWKDRAKDFE